jgi:hypothetical protein
MPEAQQRGIGTENRTVDILFATTDHVPKGKRREL